MNAWRRSSGAWDWHPLAQIKEMFMKNEILYEIPTPYGSDRIIDGDLGNACYEWRVVEDGEKIVHDTEQQYGNAEIALRDALNWCSELDL
jgi:hypothetical protein